MTEYKENSGVPKHGSLYIGMLYSLARGAVVAVSVWLVVMMVSYYFIAVQFASPVSRSERCEDYIDDLQRFVDENNIEEKNIERISDWVRDNPYVYILVYQRQPGDPYMPGPTLEPSPNDRLTEFSGSKIDDALNHDTLVDAAERGGYFAIRLAGSRVIVAIAEYTENMYYRVVNIFSVVLAIAVFVLSLVGYVRGLIDRIKRFESDVTIVSEIDMNYVIVSEGADEITNLSGKVEQMRQRMLEHIKNEQDAREANTELISSISHDIRTPLTVLMGYIEMMKKHPELDETMDGYVTATESTALRLKGLADDMLKYSLAFGDAEKAITLDEYDARTLFDQLFAEHLVLMREMGYTIGFDRTGGDLAEGSLIRTDAPNLMRIIDNIFSNMRKYADMSEPIRFTYGVWSDKLVIECKNKICTDTDGAESNGIGLKTCVRLGSLVADRFEYKNDGDYFICRLTISVIKPKE
ncbi:MAG: HAMP domain-containing histidine kinase [Clostridia bacterium]|nr:HAMP domain-containing histidine kinase [Clostridia bacterium]